MNSPAPPTPSDNEVLALRAVCRIYMQGERRLEILNGANLSLSGGETVALVAPSGAGKSTLLHVAGLLEHPDAGDVFVGGQSCGRMNDNQRTAVRRRDLGFVYQFHHLLPEFSALENVMIPLMVSGYSKKQAQDMATDELSELGLEKRLNHRPATLSGGEQQRVAIARAVVKRPRVLLADEPTGNLDPDTAFAVFDNLQRLARNYHLAMLIVTHNLDIAARMDRVTTLDHGQIRPYNVAGKPGT